MNWTRIALAGAAAGLVTWISDFVPHGMVMAATYKRLSTVFTQTEANPAWFLSFGFFLGLVIFFQRFYDPMVIDGYPYYLAWCQGGISMIDSLLAGAVIGSSLKS